MDDLKVAIEDVQEESASGEQVAAAPSRLRWAWAALVPVLLVAGFFAWRAWREPEAAEPLRAVALTTFPGVETLSLAFPRRQPRGVHVERAEAGQLRHLRAADRRRLSLAADHRSAQRLQSRLVARRALDRLPPRGVVTTARWQKRITTDSPSGRAGA